MKYRYIRMTFPDALTEDQEGILKANLEGLKQDTKAKLQKMMNEIEHGWFFKGARAIPMNSSAISALEIVLGQLICNIQNYVQYEKGPEANVFTFFYARDELALIKFGQTRFANPIQEGLMCDGLKRFVFPDMKVDSSKVLLERGDIERLK